MNSMDVELMYLGIALVVFWTTLLPLLLLYCCIKRTNERRTWNQACADERANSMANDEPFDHAMLAKLGFDIGYQPKTSHPSWIV